MRRRLLQSEKHDIRTGGKSPATADRLDGEDAARRLARKLKGRVWRDPVVLAIPRGGVVTGAVLACELDAELDVVLSRKLRAPGNSEYAIGAISEDGHVYLNPDARAMMADGIEEYLSRERTYQLAEINRRQKLIRIVRPQASLAGRSVIVTDDGIATGSTMLAALRAARKAGAASVIVAAPVASPEAAAMISAEADQVAILETPDILFAVGEWYHDFSQVEDIEVCELLAHAARRHPFRAPR